MNKKGFLVFCVLSISIIFPVSCGYSYYYTVMEADSPASGIKYEGRDEVDPLFFHKETPVDLPVESFPVFSFIENPFSEFSFDFFLPTSLRQSGSSVLRC